MDESPSVMAACKNFLFLNLNPLFHLKWTTWCSYTDLCTCWPTLAAVRRKEPRHHNPPSPHHMHHCTGPANPAPKHNSPRIPGKCSWPTHASTPKGRGVCYTQPGLDWAHPTQQRSMGGLVFNLCNRYPSLEGAVSALRCFCNCLPLLLHLSNWGPTHLFKRNLNGSRSASHNRRITWGFRLQGKTTQTKTSGCRHSAYGATWTSIVGVPWWFVVTD